MYQVQNTSKGIVIKKVAPESAMVDNARDFTFATRREAERFVEKERAGGDPWYWKRRPDARGKHFHEPGFTKCKVCGV